MCRHLGDPVLDPILVTALEHRAWYSGAGDVTGRGVHREVGAMYGAARTERSD